MGGKQTLGKGLHCEEPLPHPLLGSWTCGRSSSINWLLVQSLLHILRTVPGLQMCFAGTKTEPWAGYSPFFQANCFWGFLCTCPGLYQFLNWSPESRNPFSPRKTRWMVILDAFQTRVPPRGQDQDLVPLCALGMAQHISPAAGSGRSGEPPSCCGSEVWQPWHMSFAGFKMRALTMPWISLLYSVSMSFAHLDNCSNKEQEKQTFER